MPEVAQREAPEAAPPSATGDRKARGIAAARAETPERRRLSGVRGGVAPAVSAAASGHPGQPSAPDALSAVLARAVRSRAASARDGLGFEPHATGRVIQRTCATCSSTIPVPGPCPACAKRTPPRAAEPDAAQLPPPVRRLARAGAGRALPAPVRTAMEAGFGHDFAQVRIHDDARAAEAARSVGAIAYTHGSDIVFAPGAFRPQTPDGLRLVAHELAHVVQQDGAMAPSYQRFAIGRPDDPLERAADRAASAVVRGERVTVAPIGAGRAPSLQRTVSEICNPPSQWIAMVSPAMVVPLSAAFGLVAEKFISADVLKSNVIVPGNAYLDNPFAGPIDPGLVAFIFAKNPGLGVAQRLAVAGTSVARPDVIMHQPPIVEYEEIKPNSVAGRAAGRSKLRALDLAYWTIPLPYMAGTAYVPPPPTVIVSGTVVVPIVGPIPLKVSFQINRDRAGLLVYDICVETDWVKAAEAMLLLIAAIIAAILSRGRIGRIPMPRPLPVPVPGLAAAGALGALPPEGVAIASADAAILESEGAPAPEGGGALA
jgi:hypothetical protein